MKPSWKSVGQVLEGEYSTISISKKVCGLLTILTVIAGSGCGENASETTVTSPESVSMEASSSQGESTDMAASE